MTVRNILFIITLVVYCQFVLSFQKKWQSKTPLRVNLQNLQQLTNIPFDIANSRIMKQNYINIFRKNIFLYAEKDSNTDGVEITLENEEIIESTNSTKIEDEDHLIIGDQGTPSDDTVLNTIDEVLNINQTTNGTVTEDDLYQKEVLKLETDLQNQIDLLQDKIRQERIKQNRMRDKISESGKMGFYMIQAQVTDFQKKRDSDQKALVLKNRREFVQKIIPLIDQLRSIPNDIPSTSEREQSIHKNFGSILSSMLLILEKSGYKEYHAEIGGRLDPRKHKVARVVPGDENGIIIEEILPGIIYNNDEVIRFASVVASEVKTLTEPAVASAESAPTSQE